MSIKNYFFVMMIIALCLFVQNVFAANDLVEANLYPYDQNFVLTVSAVDQVDINANILRVQGFCFTNVDLNIDINVSGANGLDSSDSDNINTWYEVYVIAKLDGTIAGFLNEYSTSLNLPTDYVFKRQVGWVRNNASGDFLQGEQIGDYFNYDIHINVASGSTTPSTWTIANCSSAMPPTSRQGITFLSGNDANGPQCEIYVRKRGASTLSAGLLTGFGNTTACNSRIAGLLISTDMNQEIEYRSNSTSDDSYFVYILGYYLNLMN